MEDAGALLPADNVAAKAKDCSILQLKKYRVLFHIDDRLCNQLFSNNIFNFFLSILIN